MWKTPWGSILNNVYHVSVDIMELIWKKVWRFDDWIFGFFLVAKRDEQNGAISPTQRIFQEKRNICYLTESLLIENIWSSSKANDFIWILFWFLWKCCMLKDRHNPMLGYQYCYTNACLAMVQKYILKIWDDSVVNKRLSLYLFHFICDFHE